MTLGTRPYLPEPLAIVNLVEDLADRLYPDGPTEADLNELHIACTQIYAAGWSDGTAAEMLRAAYRAEATGQHATDTTTAPEPEPAPAEPTPEPDTTTEAEPTPAPDTDATEKIAPAKPEPANVVIKGTTAARKTRQLAG